MYRISARVEAVELQMSECRDAARQLPHRRAISRSGKLDSLFVIVERMTAYNLAVVGGTLPRHQTFPLAAPLRAAPLSFCLFLRQLDGLVQAYFTIVHSSSCYLSADSFAIYPQSKLFLSTRWHTSKVFKFYMTTHVSRCLHLYL